MKRLDAGCARLRAIRLSPAHAEAGRVRAEAVCAFSTFTYHNSIYSQNEPTRLRSVRIFATLQKAA